MAARGSLKFTYNGETLDSEGTVIVIPNYTTLTNQQNGLTYTVVLPSEESRLNLTGPTQNLICNIVQGSIEYQQATGTGDPLQSFNFTTSKGASIDNYHFKVFVDGKQWPIVESILDMVFEEEVCLTKTGQSGGLDLFFGNGYNGKAPAMGSTILVEYLMTDGIAGNIDTMEQALEKQWKFSSKGYSLNNEEIDLDKFISTTVENTILFGTMDEPLFLTRLLAPHQSRSFVLANADNYVHFLRKLNQFTVIDAINGFATYNDQYASDKYTQAYDIWRALEKEYKNLISTYGVESVQATDKKVEVDQAKNYTDQMNVQLNAQKKDDNTVYLFLIPDVTKRITADQDYFTAPHSPAPGNSAFRLSSAEQTAILDLIEESGQRVITVDNAILEIKYPKFVVNMSLILWEGYEYDNVREDILDALSDYYLANTRRDRIPVSDIVKIVEMIDGVDSVSVWFDADNDNKANIYETHYGIDEYGDIILERYVRDAWNNRVPVKDVYPIFRGGWESKEGTYYDDSTSKNKLSSVNIQVRGYTVKDANSKHNQAILNNTGTNK
jgi:hypothetical protein